MMVASPVPRIVGCLGMGCDGGRRAIDGGWGVEEGLLGSLLSRKKKHKWIKG